MPNHDSYPPYSLIIDWSDEDQLYIARAPDLPGCVTHGHTYEEAARKGQEAIESWVDAARADGETLPAPHVVAA
jgi:predicted RNase H-like HicB family nuclease